MVNMKLLLIFLTILIFGCRHASHERYFKSVTPTKFDSIIPAITFSDGRVYWDEKGDTVCVPAWFGPPAMDNGKFADSLILNLKYSPSKPSIPTGDVGMIYATKGGVNLDSVKKKFHLTIPDDTILINGLTFRGPKLKLDSFGNLTIDNNYKLKYDTNIFEIKNDSLIVRHPNMAAVYREFKTEDEKDAERKGWVTFFIGVCIGGIVTTSVVKMTNK